MDFLDPKAKRRHLIRLIIGYGLMAVLIGIATFILLIQAYGFDVDRKTGQVIQNGLVYVDSAPDGASIFFNEQQQKDKTNNRFALPASQYDLRIHKDGYRDWRRDFALNGGEVERFTYPLLLPITLSRQELQTADTAPTFVTESPDRRWIFMNQGNSYINFTVYDLNSLTEDQPKITPIALPPALFKPVGATSKLELVEWSTDNDHILVKHTYDGGHEFVIISREKPDTSFNINQLLGQNPSKIVLRDKKFDEWYLYSEQGGVLQTADAKKNVVTLFGGVTAFKTHDADTILYSQLAADGKTQRVSIQQGKEPYVLKEVVSASVLLDIAKYDDEWYMVVGADGEQRTFIYKDPVAVLQKRDGTKPTPRSILKTTGPMTQVGFSQNTRFIFTQSGQHFEVHDAEYNQNYKYDLSNKIDPQVKVEWMDGHRLMARSQNRAFIVDFDGSNTQGLVTSLPSTPVMFDRDYTVMYALDGSTRQPGKIGIYSTQLRLEADQ